MSKKLEESVNLMDMHKDMSLIDQGAFDEPPNITIDKVPNPSRCFFRVRVEAIPKLELGEVMSEDVIARASSGQALLPVIFRGGKALSEENRFDELYVDGETSEYLFPHRIKIYEIIKKTVLEKFNRVSFSTVCDTAKITKGTTKTQRKYARSMITRLGRTYTKSSYPDLGKDLFLRTDVPTFHVTVMRWEQDHFDMYQVFEKYRDAYDDLEATVYGTILETFSTNG